MPDNVWFGWPGPFEWFIILVILGPIVLRSAKNKRWFD